MVSLQVCNECWRWGTNFDTGYSSNALFGSPGCGRLAILVIEPCLLLNLPQTSLICLL